MPLFHEISPSKPHAILSEAEKHTLLSLKECDRNVTISPTGSVDILTAHCSFGKHLGLHCRSSLLLNYMQILPLDKLIKKLLIYHNYSNILITVFQRIWFPVISPL